MAGRGARRGLGLAELLGAIVLLTSSILAGLVARTTCLELEEGARGADAAQAELRVVLEKMLLHEPEELLDPGSAFAEGSELAGGDHPHLQDLSIRASYPGCGPGLAPPDPLPVVVTATWRDRVGRPRRTSLATLRSR